MLPLLSHPNEAISNEVLLLLKALLFSGNPVVQEDLSDFVQDTRGEVLFANLKEILDDAEVHHTVRCSVCLQASSLRIMFTYNSLLYVKGSHCSCS